MENDLIETFDRFYLEPTDKHHQDFLKSYESIVQELSMLPDQELEEEEKNNYETIFSAFKLLEEDLYNIAKEQITVQESRAKEYAAESVKLNAEIQGVEKARDVMTDTMNQQLT